MARNHTSLYFCLYSINMPNEKSFSVFMQKTLLMRKDDEWFFLRLKAYVIRRKRKNGIQRLYHSQTKGKIKGRELPLPLYFRLMLP